MEVARIDSRRIGSFDVTRLVLGCGSFGGVGSAPAFFGQGETEEQARELMDRAWDAGIRAFDTADAYGGGRSETWIGRWLRDRGSRVRDGLVLTSKVFHPLEPGPDRGGLARARILRQIETSLARLQTDRLDFYLMHEWDPAVPIEETLSAFDELVRTGKVRHAGASNVDAAQLGLALETSQQHGWTRLRCVQNSFSVLERGAERELLPACAAHDVAFTAFSPLAGGWLTGKYRAGRPYPQGSRMTLRPEPYEHLGSERVFRALAAFESAARERGVEMSTLALAWVLAQPNIAAAVIGPRTPEHLAQALAACELPLTAEEAARLAAAF